MIRSTSFFMLAGTAVLFSLSGCGGGGGGSSSGSNVLGDAFGTKFHTAFLQNYNTPEASFYMVSEKDTDVNITYSDDNSSVIEHLTANTMSKVVVPVRLVQSGTGITNKMIQLTSPEKIAVVGMNDEQGSTDASMLLPDNLLSNEYYIGGYQNIFPDELSVVAIEDGTNVNVTLPDSTELNVTLNKGQTYQYMASMEMTGAHITSDKNIAVLSGDQCADVPDGITYCDHIEEQMLPVATWEKTFITVPLATRSNGDTYRFVAAENNTTIEKDGTTVATLDAGEYYETVIDGTSYIAASSPVMALQYANGMSYDGANADPFMMLVPAIKQFSTKHIIAAVTGYTNYLNIVVPTANIADIKLDDADVNATNFTAVTGNPDYSTAQLQVTEGGHILTSSVAFGVTVYGFYNSAAGSYGYPSNLKLTKH